MAVWLKDGGYVQWTPQSLRGTDFMQHSENQNSKISRFAAEAPFCECTFFRGVTNT